MLPDVLWPVASHILRTTTTSTCTWWGLGSEDASKSLVPKEAL